MAGMVLYPRRILGSHALRITADVRARLFRSRGVVDRYHRSGQELNLSVVRDGYHASAEGSGLVRLRSGLPNRSPVRGPLSLHRARSNRPEVALGLTLMALTTITASEIAYLVHPAAALMVTLTACLSVVLAARAA